MTLCLKGINRSAGQLNSQEQISAKFGLAELSVWLNVLPLYAFETVTIIIIVFEHIISKIFTK